MVRWTAMLNRTCLIRAAACLALCACSEEPLPTPPEARSVVPSAERSQEPAEPRFGTRRELRCFGKPVGVLAGDYDGDGRTDLAATTLVPGTLQVWEHSDGQLGRRPRLIPIGDHPLPPVAVPHPSPSSQRQESEEPLPSVVIACASRADRTLVLIDPSADDGATEIQRWELSSTPRAVAAGDVRGDGSAIIVVATDTHLHLFESTGAAFAAPLFAGEGAEAVRPTCAAVWPGQRKVAVAFQLSEQLCIYALDDLTTGNGVPTACVELDGIPRAVVPRPSPSADFPDQTEQRWLVAGGEDSLWDVPLVPSASDDFALWSKSAGPIPIWLGLPDSRDGDTAITLDKYGLSFSVLTPGLEASDAAPIRPSGPSHHPGVRQTDYAGQTPVHGALADLDSDGQLDLAVANRDAARISILYGSAAIERPFSVAPKVFAGKNPVALTMADVDSDGREEVVVLNAGDGTVALLRRNDDGTFQPRVAAEVGPSPASIAAADLNGTPGDEVGALVQFADGAALVLLDHAAETDSGLLLRDESLPMGSSGSDLLLQDLDGDLFPDAVTCDPDGGRVWIRMHSGRVDQAQPLAEAQDVVVEGRPMSVAAVAREDDVHLAVVAQTGRGAGLLAFVDPNSREVIGSSVELVGLPVDVVATDLSGDGATDLVVLAQRSATVKGGIVHVLIQESGGWRREAPLASGVEPKKIVAIDLDGDGTDDLVTAARGSHNVNAWLTRQRAGALVFLPLSDLGAGLGPMDVGVTTWAGRTELLVPNTFSGSLSVIRVTPTVR